MKKLVLIFGAVAMYTLVAFKCSDNSNKGNSSAVLTFCHTIDCMKEAKIMNLQVGGLYGKDDLDVTGRILLETKGLQGESVRLLIDLNSIDFDLFEDLDTGNKAMSNN